MKPNVTDRWCEMSLNWFDPARVESQAAELLDRLAPLYRSAGGTRGLLVDFALIPDLILLWEGDAAQPIPEISRRIERWRGRTYADLKRLFVALREAALHRGLAGFRVGTLCCAHGHLKNGIYAIHAPFNERHPEAYASPATVLCHSTPLKADSARYAAFPEGIPEGAMWTEVFARQWGALSRWLGMDALLLRDYFLAPGCYTREGRFGATASSEPAKNEAITADAIALVRTVKQANPEAWVMGYSWAASAVGEWRVGGADLERIVADGQLDAFIDQTWGGAWQDWWSYDKLGHTMQLANLLVHGAMIAKANLTRKVPCRFYHLIETWDAWEPWDVLHQVPEKLRWEIWAYSHAAVQAPTGWKVPDGSYLSWVNERHQGRIWSAGDVEFLRRNLDAAQASAASLEHVHGPLLVTNRPLLERLHASTPAENASEWIDEQVGMLLKWGVPCLGSTRIEWLEPESCEGAILQVPGQIEPSLEKRLLAAVGKGMPCLAVGRADLLSPSLLKAGGIKPHGKRLPASFQDLEFDPSVKVPVGLHKGHFPEVQPVSVTTGRALVRSGASAFLVRSKPGNFLWWQPPDWLFPKEMTHRFCQYGSLAPHFAVARTLSAAMHTEGRVSADGLAPELPATVHLWRSGGVLHVLVGNLETGVAGDARTPRRVRLSLPRGLAGGKGSGWVLREVERGEVLKAREGRAHLDFEIPIAPEGSGVYVLDRVRPRRKP